MGNKEIAANFNLLAALMELHGENAFKTKSYQSAYQSLRKWDRPLREMTIAEIAAIPGVGSSAATRINEMVTNGVLEPLEILKSKTPLGIQQLLSIKGMGPKKIRAIWDELGVETPAELLFACNENRLVKLAGFGLKTQEDLAAKITYFLDSQHRYLYGVIENDLLQFEKKWNKAFPDHTLTWAGEIARRDLIISSIDCVITNVFDVNLIDDLEEAELIEQTEDNSFSIRYADRYAIRFVVTTEKNFINTWGELTMSHELYNKLEPVITKSKDVTTDAFLAKNKFADLPGELLNYEGIENMKPSFWEDIITEEDIKGIVHNHSTYSDGIHTLEQMATYVRDQGYEYFGICDHSQTAFYANGLTPDRVIDQWDEIDRLNKKLAPFIILKGIESDILTNGLLDYDEEMLSGFDLVVASIHSNLRMDEHKATARLIAAIENPYTNILGHPTGRLLLARPGYPINHKKVIDACAENNVAIELNANPQRMEIDYKWIDYCQEKGVWVSINPDAHSRTQIGYMRYGVMAARKGALKRENCLNALPLNEFRKVIKKAKAKK